MAKLVRGPSLYQRDQFDLEQFNDTHASVDGKWVHARSIPFQYGPIGDLRRRFRLAWGVFTGRYDALQWGGNQ